MNNELSATLSKFDSITDWERSDRRDGLKVELAPLRDLLEQLGNPQKSFRTVHVAGTKGKGSVAALVELGLEEAGIPVGRFSSPHVETITERITFGGIPIREQALSEVLERALQARELAKQRGTPGQSATRFDLETLGAILAFADAGLEWAVIECGLGGRLDSTNTVDGEVAVLTNVDLEHTAILGATRSAIAYQKIGILKRGAALVTSVAQDSEAGCVIWPEAASLGCPVILRPPPGPDRTIKESNAGLASAVLDELGRRGVKVSRGENMVEAVTGLLLDEAVARRASLPGRMERLEISSELVKGDGLGEPRRIPVILDGAHVPSSLEHVWREFGHATDLAGPCVAVVGFGRDKKVEDMFNILSGKVSLIVCTSAKGGPPAFSPEQLADLVTVAGIDAEIREDPVDALLRAAAVAAEQGWILVTGSLHLVGAVRPFLISRPETARCAQP
jgi:dihydrofolate synthase/folylpolyglutamate synthase